MKHLFKCVFLFRAIILIQLFLVIFSLSISAESSFPPIKSACEYDYPPYCFVKDDSIAAGFSVELLTEALKVMNLEVVFKTGYWSDLKEDLKVGRIEVLPLAGRTPDREKYYDFSISYLTMHGVIVVRSDNNNILKLNDLKGKKIAVLKGDNAEEYIIRKNFSSEINATPTFNDALIGLSNGIYDAVVIQNLLAVQLINDLHLDNLKIVSPPLEDFEQDFCFAVKEGDKELLSVLNEGLSIIIENGVYRQLQSKWFAPLKIKMAGSIIVGADFNYPPWEYLDENGKPAGFIVDLTKAIALEMNLGIQFYFSTWTDVKTKLDEGEIEVLQGMYYSPERTEDYEFSSPHFTTSFTAVTRKGDKNIQSKADLDGKIIIVQKDDIMHEYALQNIKPESIIVKDTPEEALELLSKGTGDCVLIGKTQAQFFIDKNKWGNLYIKNATLNSSEYCYAVRRGNQHVLSLFDEGLGIIKHNGEYRKIKTKWFGKDERENYVAIFRIIIISAIMAFFIIASLFIASYILKKRVEKRTEELRKSEENLRVTLNSIGDAVISTDINGIITSINPVAQRLTGWDDSSAIGEKLTDVFKIANVKTHEIIENPFEKVIKEGEQVGLANHTALLSRDGGEYQIADSGAPIKNRDGKIIGVVLVFRDVTQDYIVREALVESEEKYRNLFETMEQGVIYQDREGNIVSSNRAAEKMLEPFMEFSTNSKKNDSGWFLVDQNDNILEKDLFPPMLTMKSGEKIDKALIAVCNGMNQEKYWIIISCVPQFRKYEKMPYQVYSAFQDITQLKKAEDEMRKLDRLNSLGVLAGGIAHDFNNLLTGIMGNIEIVINGQSEESDSRKYAEEALKESENASRLARQLLTFSSGGKPIKTLISTKELLENTTKFIIRGSDALIDLKIAEDIQNIKADEGQIRQAISNIIINAKQAKPEGLVLKISVENIIFQEETSDVESGKYVKILISDNGPGIEMKYIDKIFDPYFTTKKSGSGIGLAVVDSVIKKHNGKLYVENTNEGGAKFTILLPAAEKEYSLQNFEDSKKDYVEIKGKTILIMDDEEIIRYSTSAILNNYGFIADSAKNGEEAIEKYKEALQSGKPYDAVILDLTVQGGMGGKETARLMLDLKQDAFLIVSSGYSEDAIMAEYRKYGFSGVVAKPYRGIALVKAIQKMLCDKDKTD